MPVDTEKLMVDKRVERWAAWFVSPDFKLLRFNSDEHGKDDLPTDGLLAMRLKFADGTGDSTNPSGWTIYMDTPHGLLFASTGDNVKPDPDRYPGAKFIKDKLAPSNIYHVAVAEANQWQ